MTVRTRFAPSPTGPLHIGGVRTALFNYLYSRHLGGEFLLRIEDTDRERSTAAATQGIIDSLDWLGLDRDEPTVFQSQRMDRHAEVARGLLAAGKAYYCYATPAELAAEREQARVEKRVWRYDGRWRDRDPSEAPPGIAPVIRLKSERNGETVLEDLVQGTVRVANVELDDMIILRSDGSPMYNHSVVVDDHDMAITHVIRGDDHLTNTFRQIQVYRAMGWDLPRFAHIPLIHGADGAKLSKRHGAQFALEFRDQGFLPEALCNYLLRLGWSHGDLEIVGREEAIRLFDIVDVNRGAARMELCQAAQPERRVYPAGGRRPADQGGAGAAGSPAGPIGWRERCRADHGTDAGAEGARENACGTDGFGRVPGTRGAVADGAEGRGGADGGGQADAARRWSIVGDDGFFRRCDRRGVAGVRGAERSEAGPGGAAVAGGTDRQHRQSRDRRDTGGSGTRGEFAADRGGVGLIIAACR